MIVYEGIGGVVLFLAMAILAIYFYGRMCRDAGFEEGRADAYREVLAEDEAGRQPQLAGNPAAPGRHRISQPRADAPFPAAEPPARTAPRQIRPVSWREVFRDTPELAAAADIPAALLAAPAPAPDLNGAGDTATMPRLNLPATTGEMAAITDQYIADMAAEETADRARRALAASGES